MFRNTGFSVNIGGILIWNQLKYDIFSSLTSSFFHTYTHSLFGTKFPLLKQVWDKKTTQPANEACWLLLESFDFQASWGVLALRNVGVAKEKLILLSMISCWFANCWQKWRKVLEVCTACVLHTPLDAHLGFLQVWNLISEAIHEKIKQ